MTPSVCIELLSFSSSNLLSIISGLLVRVAMELAVFLRVEGCGGGEGWISFSFSFSLFVELRDNQEKALESFRVGGGGGGGESD